MIRKIEKTLSGDYPYDGVVKWNLDAIKRGLDLSKKNKILPNFNLERVEIHPTSLCQYKCPFCYGVNFKNKKRVELPLNIIETHLFRSIRNDNLFKDSDPIIILAGLYSEPLVYLDFIRLMDLVGKYKFRFSIYTNGGLINKDIIEKICHTAKMAQSRKTSYIALNITASILHKQYGALIENIKLLIKIRDELNSPLQILVPILIDGNYLSRDRLRKIQKELLRLGIDKIRYSLPQQPVSSHNLINIKQAQIINELERSGHNKVYVRSKSEKRFDKCFVIANTLSIDHMGSVYPCSQTCSGFFSGLSYGSIRKQKLSKIWRSKKHSDLFYKFGEIPVYCRCNHADEEFNTICSSLY